MDVFISSRFLDSLRLRRDSSSSASFSPFHVFRLPTDPPADSLSVDPWSDCWTKIPDARIRGVVCGVALLIRALKNADQVAASSAAAGAQNAGADFMRTGVVINVVVASRDAALKTALAANHKIAHSISVIDSAAEIRVRVSFNGCGRTQCTRCTTRPRRYIAIYIHFIRNLILADELRAKARISAANGAFA